MTSTDTSILSLVRRGKTNLEIAQLLGYSESYIKRRISYYLHLYSVSRRGQL